MSNDIDEKDDFDFALAEAIKQGRVIKTKDDEGRDVYTAAPVN